MAPKANSAVRQGIHEKAMSTSPSNKNLNILRQESIYENFRFGINRKKSTYRKFVDEQELDPIDSVDLDFGKVIGCQDSSLDSIEKMGLEQYAALDHKLKNKYKFRQRNEAKIFGLEP